MDTIKEKLIEQWFEIMSVLETQFEKSIKLQEKVQWMEWVLIKEIIQRVYKTARIELLENGFWATTIKIYNS